MDPQKKERKYEGPFPLPDYLKDEPPFIIPEEPGSSFDDVVPITVVPRSAWGARQPKSQVPMIFPIIKVKFTGEDVYKHDTYLSSALRKVQNAYMDVLNEPDVPYNFLVDEGGLIYEGRGWKTASKWGNNILEIAFLGDHSGRFDTPSFDKCDAAHSLIMQGVDQNLVDINFGILSLKNKADYKPCELKWFPNFDDARIPVPAPYGN